ncbi:MAG: hypothetical protein FWD57_08470, partial [Polyangiaceae bacterium]|nr:hypothetical protein [Polyangiaceae bacterium]
MATIEEQEYGAPTFVRETCTSRSPSPSAERSIARIALALAVTPIENGFSHEAEILVAAHVAAFGDAHLFEATTSAPSPSWS